MTLEEQKASQKTSYFIFEKKNPQNKHQLINPKHTDYEKRGKVLAGVVLKELVSMLVKARCGAHQMEGRGELIHGADLISSWHAV